jgi:PEP-CTERM motif
MLKHPVFGLIMLITTMSVVGSGSARAALVYDSIGIQPSNGIELIDSKSGYRLAQEFKTRTDQLQLDSVILSMFGSGTAIVSIYTDGLSGGHAVPGSLVYGGTLVSSGYYNPTTLTDTTFTASGLTLNSATNYWVVLQATSGSFNWSYGNLIAYPVPYNDPKQYGSWYADPPYSFLNDDSFANLTDFSAPFQMDIYASNPPAVPEPSTYVLLGIALGTVGFARRRMNRSEG